MVIRNLDELAAEARVRAAALGAAAESATYAFASHSIDVLRREADAAAATLEQLANAIREAAERRR